MDFNPQIQKGDFLTNEEISKLFRCAIQGGMRRSLKTNSLVLVTDKKGNTYKNISRDDNEIWWFSGMGNEMDQTTDYKSNKTLYNSNIEKVNLFLFIKVKEKKYEYIGKMLLIGEPRKSSFNNFEILEFPLLEKGISMDASDFLNKYLPELLYKKEIINGPKRYLNGRSYKNLIQLMKEAGINTLTGNDGWFLNQQGYFFNQYSKKNNWGHIEELIEKKDFKTNAIFIGQNKYINPFFKNSLVSNISTLNYSSMTDMTPTIANKKNEIDLFESDGQILRIQSLKIKYLKEQITYKIELSNVKQDNKDNFYTTLLIGSNGGGKSRVLSSIQKIFLDMYLLNTSSNNKYSGDIEFEMNYTINGISFSIKKQQGIFFFYKEGIKVGFKEILLPESVISCAFTLQDRFTNDKNQRLNKYHYFGIKNQSFEGMIDSLSEIIIKAVLTDHNFLMNFENITDFLGFEPELKIVLNFKKNRVFLDDFNKINLINNTNLSHLIPYFDKISSSIKKNKNDLFKLSAEKLEIHFKFADAKKYEELYEQFELIIGKDKNDLFESQQIMLKKNHNWISIEHSSSGEFQYISNMINILSKITDSSLILIDEPETSLHPNWQFKYLYVLDKIFKEYTGCHFILATHSHFLVSDLKKDSTSLIELVKESSEYVHSKMINENVYGRSAEDILYDIFNMPTSRNYHLANDLDEILKAISLKKIDENIKRKVEKISIVKEYLKPEDPLNELIEVMNKRIDKI